MFSSDRRRWWAAAAVLALVMVAAPGPGRAQPSPPAGQGQGEDLYLQSCASCHGVQGEGTQRGPGLVGAGAASVDFQLSTGRMPLEDERQSPERGEPAFTPDEIDALVRHVEGFGGGGPPVPVVGPGDPRTGRALYLATCAACHSATGAGGTLTGGESAPPLYQATPTQVAEAIRVGPGLMPVFPAEVYDEREVDAIAAYVDVLQGEPEEISPGGWSLGRLGPFAEGAIGVLVGLGLLLLIARWLGSRAGE